MTSTVEQRCEQLTTDFTLVVAGVTRHVLLQVTGLLELLVATCAQEWTVGRRMSLGHVFLQTGQISEPRATLGATIKLRVVPNFMDQKTSLTLESLAAFGANKFQLHLVFRRAVHCSVVFGQISQTDELFVTRLTLVFSGVRQNVQLQVS